VDGFHTKEIPVRARARVSNDEMAAFVPGAQVYFKRFNTDFQPVFTVNPEDADPRLPHAIGTVEQGEKGICIVLNSRGEQALAAV
jgi:hypothetical protein